MTFELVNSILFSFVRFIFQLMMIFMLFMGFAIVIAGTVFVFRVAFSIWFDGKDVFNYIEDFFKGIRDSIIWFKELVKSWFKK